MHFFRWPVSRAVPELDPLSRDRAKAFVNSAERAWKGRLTRWALVLLAAVVTYVLLAVVFAVVMLIGGVALVERFEGLSTTARVSLLSFVLLCVLFSAGVTHRWLVIRAVRVALADRARCRCGYTIAGQRLDERLSVRCPECGLETVADPALGEVDGEGGARTFLPRHPQVPRLLTKKRVVRTAKAALVLFFLTGFVGAAWWGVNRWLHAKDAALAAKERPTPTQVAAIALAGQPSGSGDEENAYEVLRSLLAQVAQVESAVRAEWPEGPTYGDYSLIEAPSLAQHPLTAAQEKEEAATRELAMRYLRAHAQRGTWDTMKRLAACRRAVRPIPSTELAAAMTANLPELAAVRQVARINVARMRLAIKAGDADEFADALEVNLALGRILAMQPMLIDRLVSLAIESLTLQQARAAITARPEPAWLDGIERAVAAQRVDAPLRRALEGERLYSLDAAAAGVIADAEGRAGGSAPGFVLSGAAPGSLPWWGAGRDAINAVFDAAIARAALARPDRPVFTPVSTGIDAVDQLGPAIEKSISSSDQLELERTGLASMIALERCRLSTGAYPQALSELVPAQLASLPIDPWSGRPIGYRRLDAAADPLRRGYLLWSVGHDGVDNGGTTGDGPNRYGALFSRESQGIDFIINDPER